MTARAKARETKETGVRALPAVDAVLKSPAAATLEQRFGRHAVVEGLRDELQTRRAALRKGGAGDVAVSPEAILTAVDTRLTGEETPRLRRAINATGIILHTGLGRAHMPEAARTALAGAAGYCNLQLDLESGKRGRREENLLDRVRRLTGAEDACLVNNNAGATMLVLKALAEGREVVVSRGELIEIGGSFRLPDIMKESGAILREIGTTNKTHAKDYEAAIGPQTALLFKAHKSNYRMVGFTAEVDIAAVAGIGKRKGVPVVDDLGAGALVDLAQFGLPHEPTVQESLKAGADVVLFSTDKLIGGPQGGLIVGSEALITKIRKHPLYRILRVCKLTLAALEATLRLFTSPDLLVKRHPVYAMLGKTSDAMRQQADDLAARLTTRKPDWKVTVVETTSFLGGGSLPEEALPSWAVRIETPNLSADDLAIQFRAAAVPVVPRIADGAVLLDMRTVFPADIDDVVAAT